jgi:lipopolysaccharide export system protein LptA
MVVSGAVAIDEPGFHATGARLVYTASDQVFLLTGEKGVPPRATDAQGRMTTGAALRFQSCGGGGAQNVEALGTAPGMPTQRVRTESRVEDEKKQTGKR